MAFTGTSPFRTKAPNAPTGDCGCEEGFGTGGDIPTPVPGGDPGGEYGGPDPSSTITFVCPTVYVALEEANLVIDDPDSVTLGIADDDVWAFSKTITDQAGFSFFVEVEIYPLKTTLAEIDAGEAFVWNPPEVNWVICPLECTDSDSDGQADEASREIQFEVANSDDYNLFEGAGVLIKAVSCDIEERWFFSILPGGDPGGGGGDDGNENNPPAPDNLTASYNSSTKEIFLDWDTPVAIGDQPYPDGYEIEYFAPSGDGFVALDTTTSADTDYTHNITSIYETDFWYYRVRSTTDVGGESSWNTVGIEVT